MVISQFILSTFLFISAFQAGSEKEFQISEDLKTFKESVLKENLGEIVELHI